MIFFMNLEDEIIFQMTLHQVEAGKTTTAKAVKDAIAKGYTDGRWEGGYWVLNA